MSHFARGLSVAFVATLFASSVILTTTHALYIDHPEMNRLPVEQVKDPM
jgi:hypothetical protein